MTHLSNLFSRIIRAALNRSVILLVGFLSISLISEATTYYFSSTSGNDSYTSAQAQNQATPWKSIAKLNSFFSSLVAGDNVFFKRGETFYGTIVVSKSGTSGSPIVIGAYGSGAKPIITGFTTISGWTNEGSGIYSKVISSDALTNMVTIDGVQYAMGRYPDATYLSYESFSSNVSITDNTLGTSTNWTGAEALIRKNDWTLDRCLINNHSGNTLTYTNKGSTQEGTANFGYFIQNDLRTLTTYGEWYHNTGTGKFYMYFGSVTPTTKVVNVATTNYLLSNSGNDNITIDNLIFTGSINNGIFFSSGNDNCKVQNCDLSFLGRNGILHVSGANLLVANSTIAYCNTNGVSSDGSNTVISNNIIANIGNFKGQSLDPDAGMSGIFSPGNGVKAELNYIHNIGGSGVNIKYIGAATIQNNLIDTVCTLLDDGAGIYTSGLNSSVRLFDRNIILNVVGNSEGTNNTYALSAGIFLDEDASNVTISNNTIANILYNGIKLHRSNNNTIIGNTTYNNYQGIYFQNTSGVGYLNNKLRKNIFFAKEANQLPLQFYSLTNSTTSLTADSNYYVRPIDDNLTLSYQQPSTNYYWVNTTLAGWQSYTGQEANSKKSPKNISDVSQLNFQYNASSSPKVVTFSGLSYMDATGTVYNNSATIPAWSSLVLIANGTASGGTSLLPAVNPANTVNGLDYKYYEGDWTVLPAFTSLTPVKTGKSTNFDITLTNRATQYGFSFSGYINVPADGQYTFYTSSDDGSSLYIDNVLTVSNDGIHASNEKSGIIGLKAGKHLITGLYFQQAGGQVFEVRYEGNGVTKQLIPASVLYRANNAPAVNAGADQTITLPINTVTLTGNATDSDGTISTYSWVKISGPATGTIANAASASTALNNLVQGVYQYVLSATDNEGAIGKDTINITVNGASGSNLLPAVIPASTVNGLDYKYYEGDWTVLPAFTSLTPVKIGTTSNFNLSLANRSTQYGFSFTGYINVPTDGQYTFYTSSDDGSNLYIDNVLTVSNDGIHASIEKAGTIGLKAGMHAITGLFFQQAGSEIFQVSYEGTGISKQAIPASVLYRSVLNLLPAVTPANTINGLDYKYYEGDWNVLPSFTDLTSVKTGTVTNFDLTPANKTIQYGFSFTGYINVPSDGQYTFYTSSDDGSNLYIDNVLTVSNDGIHASIEKSGTIGLKAGLHAITGLFFQQAGEALFQVSYEGTGISKQLIPSSVLFRSGLTLLPATTASNTVNGLDYKYYEGDWSVLPAFSSLTPIKTGTSTNFDLTPANRTSQYGFNFTGYINVPSDGQYTFYTSSDDGSNLYIDDVLIVNNDGIHGSIEKSGIIGLKAGFHAISGLFFQQEGEAVFQVSYAGTGITKQLIPASVLFRSNLNLLPAVNPANTASGLNFKYYEGNWSVLPAFSSLIPVKTGSTTTFDLTPANRTSQYGFSFAGYITVPADGQYTFYTSSDDGSNLYIDNVLIVSNDGLHAATEKSGTIGLKAGKHEITGLFFQQAGEAVFQVSYESSGISKQLIPASSLTRENLLPAVNPANTINGLDYKYYEGNWSVLPTFSALTPAKTGNTNNFDLTVANRTTQYGFSFTGYINIPTDGQYTFYTSSDDGSNLYIDDVLVVANDGIHAPIEKSGVIGLKAGKHAITGLFFQQTGGAVFQVSYEGTGITKQLIPASALYRIAPIAGRSANVGLPLTTSLNSTVILNTNTTFKISSYPNPTTYEFGLFVEGGSNEKVDILVIDTHGKTVFQTTGASNRKYKFGSKFLPGLYIIKVVQGNTLKILKVVKG